MPNIPPKVFISYSHDSDEHCERVLNLSDQLREDGIDCFIDQYINGAPPEGWQRWMKRQIIAADFVLIVCTDRYRMRFDGEDREGGRGVTYEGAIITQLLYDEFQENTKFSPVIPDDGSIDNVPLEIKGGSTFRIAEQYEEIYRVLTDQPKAVARPIGPLKHYGNQQTVKLLKSAVSIQIDRLPTVVGDFFGRETELQMLGEALAKRDQPGSTRIMQFIASGGTGKTKLLRHWLNQHVDTISNYIIWSLYSQGTSDNKQASATPLFTEAFKDFGVDYEQYRTDEDRADAFADLLIEHQCLLVLDGLEPLQHGGSGFDGQLKDRAMKRLLQKLAQGYSSLCIITTRIKVHELKDRTHVISHPLDNLSIGDGVKLLRSWCVQGNDNDMQQAVSEVEGHALTLHLLGNALTTYLDSDIRKRDTLDELVDGYSGQGKHAFKVMQAYQHWLRDESGEPAAELQLLYLLGLFDHPIEVAVLQVLWEGQIVGLTASPKTFWQKLFRRKGKSSQEENKRWQVAIHNLQKKHRLLSQHGGRPDLLDCHPLIREFFGRKLEQQQPDAWQQAHEALYNYYKTLPERELPGSVEEMQPLFHAVAHGCAAGLHKQALEEVYWPRIRRESEDFIVKKLGAFSDDLAVVANFFSQPWSEPVVGLGEVWHTGVLNWAGVGLRALGRLREAVEPTQTSVDERVKQERWKSAAINTCNLSELQLTLGRVADAVTSGECGVAYADQSGDLYRRMVNLTTQADALHQAGQIDKALFLFEEAEALQHMLQPELPWLYSFQGFCYCELLLTHGNTVEVLKQTEQAIEIAKRNNWLLDIALDKLTLGRAHHAQGDLSQARDWLEQAVSGLRKAGQQDDLPRGLLARAALHRDSDEFDLAERDLSEVWEIAESGEMRLFMVDYHLECACLLLTSKSDGGLQHHLQAADELITATGYGRRMGELAELKAQCQSVHPIAV